MKLDGKRILVTGSTMGIGWATAQALLDQGARVAVHGRSLAKVQATIKGLRGGERAVPVSGDVAIVADCRAIVDQAVAQLGGLDCLVNNAGIGDLSYPEDVTEEHFDRIVDVNLRSVYFLTQQALPELKKSQGSTIFIASASAHCAGPTDSYVYACAKSGLVAMGQTLAVELAPQKVRVTVVCPGYIDTPLIAAENAAHDGQIYKFIEECVPAARIGSMAECAATIAYLASDDAGYLVGSVVSNDGGISATRSWGGRN